MAGHQASASSITKSFRKALRYESSVVGEQLSIVESTSLRMPVVSASVERFRAYDFSMALARAGLRCVPSTAEMSLSQRFVT